MNRVSYITGEKGRNRVRVFLHPRSMLFYLEYRDRGRRVRVALGHRDRERAKAEAEEFAARLRRPGGAERDLVTLAELFDTYLREVTPTKGAAKQAHDRRTLALAASLWGPARRATDLTHRDAARFVAVRRQRGDQRPGVVGRPLRGRAVSYDVALLKAVFTWAVHAGWLERNPLAGFRVDPGASPRRPLLTAAEYDAMLAGAGAVHPVFRTALILAHETGHRRGALRLLRWEDVELERGWVRWRAESDKTGFEHATALTEAALAALREARRRPVMSPWVLPSPRDPSRPVSADLLRLWWRRAERRAGLVPEPGRGWHSLRRQFATELKHVPLKDLCALGGWRSPETILECYQQADPLTMREALRTRRPLEARAT